LDVFPNSQTNLSIYKAQTGVTFPLCYDAREVGNEYKIREDFVVIIDIDGKIFYRNNNPHNDINEIGNVLGTLLQ
jgi:hypothetical protein